jgi:hypothetical protein
MKDSAYVFITTKQPRKVVKTIRRFRGVVRADGLLGGPDAIAIIEGDDVTTLDSMISRIAATPGVVGTESKIAQRILEDSGGDSFQKRRAHSKLP